MIFPFFLKLSFFCNSFSFSGAKTCRISLKVQMWKSPKIEFLSKKTKNRTRLFL